MIHSLRVGMQIHCLCVAKDEDRQEFCWMFILLLRFVGKRLWLMDTDIFNKLTYRLLINLKRFILDLESSCLINGNSYLQSCAVFPDEYTAALKLHHHSDHDDWGQS
jgi:hypothetical protein